MTLYCNLDWKSALETQKLATFDQIWNSQVDWIDEPNLNRGGWSGVGCIQVLFHDKMVTLFVKKQLNHTKRTLLHPIKGKPTFATEFRTIRFIQDHGLLAPNVVFFGQRSVKDGQQAILVTEMLEGYQSLESLKKSNLSILRQRDLLRSVAQTICKLHKIGVQHRSLYAKHIFVKSNEKSFNVALIDLEKSRRMLLPCVQSLPDLITLNYRTKGWNKRDHYYFYKQYLDCQRLSLWNIILCHYIKIKSAKKSS